MVVVAVAAGAFDGRPARSGRCGGESGCRRRAGAIGPRAGDQAGGSDERGSARQRSCWAAQADEGAANGCGAYGHRHPACGEPRARAGGKTPAATAAQSLPYQALKSSRRARPAAASDGVATERQAWERIRTPRPGRRIERRSRRIQAPAGSAGHSAMPAGPRPRSLGTSPGLRGLRRRLKLDGAHTL